MCFLKNKLKQNYLFLLFKQKEFAEPVLEALVKCSKSSMNDILGRLEEHEREIVLKYVYYGFQAKPTSATEFLSWQQTIVKKDGLGAIVRVCSDIKKKIY